MGLLDRGTCGNCTIGIAFFQVPAGEGAEEKHGFATMLYIVKAVIVFENDRIKNVCS
jgi:hypothetical protein